MAPPLTSSVSGVVAVASPQSPPESRSSAWPSSLDPQRVEELALSLFELRAACEADLRALTTIQRSLERVRCSRTTQGERDLLLGEMARLLDESDAKASIVADLRQLAAERLVDCRQMLTAR